MPTLVSTFGVVAVLSAFAVLLLQFGSRLPEPLRDADGSGAIGFAFFVYFVALVSLSTGAVGWVRVKEILRSRFKYLFLASSLIVIAYVGYVSLALYGLSQSTDL